MAYPITDAEIAELRAGLGGLPEKMGWVAWPRFNPDKIAALLARLDAAEGGWQDIATAPKDGTQFLATGGGLGDDVDIVSYNDRVGCWDATNYTLDDTDHETQGYNRPTHWRPLPAPPKAGG